MGTALYTPTSSAINPDCPHRLGHAIRWSDDLPPILKDLVVLPIRFDVAREYEMLADHTLGRDASNEPCYCAFRFVLTQLCSDDDEVFYEVPAHAELLTSWRLLDERWLVCRTTVNDFDRGEFQTSLSLSDSMPR